MKKGDLVQCAVLRHWGIGIVTCSHKIPKDNIDMCYVRWGNGKHEWIQTIMLDSVKHARK